MIGLTSSSSSLSKFLSILFLEISAESWEESRDDGRLVNKSLSLADSVSFCSTEMGSERDGCSVEGPLRTGESKSNPTADWLLEYRGLAVLYLNDIEVYYYNVHTSWTQYHTNDLEHYICIIFNITKSKLCHDWQKYS